MFDISYPNTSNNNTGRINNTSLPSPPPSCPSLFSSVPFFFRENNDLDFFQPFLNLFQPSFALSFIFEIISAARVFRISKASIESLT